MTATQAPAPGPLDWDYDKVEMIADLIEKYTYVMSKHNPDLARVAGHNSCAQHILAALAPTAPVEASGSERERLISVMRDHIELGEIGSCSAEIVGHEEAADAILALRPQPSGGTR